MAKLGERVLGEFQLSGAAIISENQPFLASAFSQDDSFSRTLEEEEIIVSDTFFSPVFEGTQNLVRDGRVAESLASVQFIESDTLTAAGESVFVSSLELFDEGVTSSSAGNTIARNTVISVDGIPRKIFSDVPILRQGDISINEKTITFEGDVISGSSVLNVESIGRQIDGDTILSDSIEESDILSRTIDGEVSLIDSFRQQDIFTRTLEEDEVIMSNTFISPVFEGTQNLVRDGNITDSVASTLAVTFDITAGIMVNRTASLKFDSASNSGSAGDILNRTASNVFNQTDVLSSAGNVLQVIGSEFVATGIISGSDGSIIARQIDVLDDSFSRNISEDEVILRTAELFTDSFASTLERDIALTIQSLVLGNEFTQSIDGDIQQAFSAIQTDAFTETIDGEILSSEPLVLSDELTRKIEDEEIVMSNTFFAPVFDGTQNLVRTGDIISSDSEQNLPTIALTVQKRLQRDASVQFDETDVFASAGDTISRIATDVIEQIETTGASGDVVSRTMNEIFDSTFVATSDGRTISLLSVEFGETDTSTEFTDEPIELNAQLSVESISSTTDIDNVLSADNIILDNSISRNTDGDILQISPEQFVDVFVSSVDGDVYVPERNLFADTFTTAVEEDEIIMSNTFFVPVFDGTQNLVRSGSISDSSASSIQPTIGITAGASVLSSTESLFDTSDIAASAGDTFLAQSLELDPEYDFIANPGTVIREIGAGSSQLAGSQIGLFQLGLGAADNGTILRGEGETFRTAIGQVINPQRTVFEDVFSKTTADVIVTSAFTEEFIDESIARKFDGEIIDVLSDEFTELLTRTFDGKTAQALASQIEAFRILTTWALGQRQLGTVIEETREYETLELTIRYQKSARQQAVQEILDRSQKSEVLERSTGGFRTVDTGNNDVELNLRAPNSRKDLRPIQAWYVADYDRTLVDRNGEVYDLDLELYPRENKAYDNEFGTFESEPSTPVDESVWNFEFEFGNFNTRQVSVEYSETPSGTAETNEITMILTKKEARIVEENASQLNLVQVRSVPDGFDVVDDTSVDERHTVSISPPGNNDEPIEQDEYVIQSWNTEWNGSVFEVTMEVSK